METLKAVSIFCGAGGLDIGFKNAGCSIIWANDFNKDACETHRLWSGADVFCGDIGKVTEIPDCDIILGGFPCQGFSLSGPRKIDDKRNTLYKHYVRIVKEKQPLAFIGENVKGLLSMESGLIMDAILSEFSKCGYDVFYKLLNAKDYGVPQDRERVIIAGFRKDLNVTEFSFPQPQSGKVTMRMALQNVPKPSENDVCRAPYSSRYMSRNRKRGWDEVSFTIPAMAKQVPLWPGSPDMVKIDADRWMFGENGITRRLSWKEAAAIQTFPEGMEFCGNLTSKYKQIGNAVPVKLAECIAEPIRKILLSKM